MNYIFFSKWAKINFDQIYVIWNLKFINKLIESIQFEINTFISQISPASMGDSSSLKKKNISEP